MVSSLKLFLVGKQFPQCAFVLLILVIGIFFDYTVSNKQILDCAKFNNNGILGSSLFRLFVFGEINQRDNESVGTTNTLLNSTKSKPILAMDSSQKNLFKSNASYLEQSEPIIPSSSRKSLLIDHESIPTKTVPIQQHNKQNYVEDVNVSSSGNLTGESSIAEHVLIDQSIHSKPLALGVLQTESKKDRNSFAAVPQGVAVNITSDIHSALGTANTKDILDKYLSTLPISKNLNNLQQKNFQTQIPLIIQPTQKGSMRLLQHPVIFSNQNVPLGQGAQHLSQPIISQQQPYYSQATRIAAVLSPQIDGQSIKAQSLPSTISSSSSSFQPHIASLNISANNSWAAQPKIQETQSHIPFTKMGNYQPISDNGDKQESLSLPHANTNTLTSTADGSKEIKENIEIKNTEGSQKVQHMSTSLSEFCFNHCKCWPVWTCSIFIFIIFLLFTSAFIWFSASLFSRGFFGQSFYKGGGYWLIGVSVAGLSTGLIIGGVITSCVAIALTMGAGMLALACSIILVGRRGAWLGALGGTATGACIGMMSNFEGLGIGLGIGIGFLVGLVLGFAPIAPQLKINERYIRRGLRKGLTKQSNIEKHNSSMYMDGLHHSDDNLIRESSISASESEAAKNQSSDAGGKKFSFESSIRDPRRPSRRSLKVDMNYSKSLGSPRLSYNQSLLGLHTTHDAEAGEAGGDKSDHYDNAK